MKPFLKIVISATLVYFFSWFFAYKIGVNDLPIQSEDTLPAILMPVTIIKEGTIYLDSYYDMLLEKYPHPDDKDYQKGLVPFYLRKITSSNSQTHYVSAFPIVTSLLALPVYFFPVILGMPINFVNITILAHLASALIVAFSGGFLYLLLKGHFFQEEPQTSLIKQKSFLLTAIYLFGTINYAHISQALWQHGTVQLLTILALLFLYKKRYVLTGLFFGLMLLSRPTSAIAVGLLGLLALIRHLNLESLSFSGILQSALSKKEAVLKLIGRIILGMVPTILFFLWYNKTFYQSIANQGYSNQIFTEWKGRFPEGFLGLWLSPSKGILIYSPIFLLSLYGIYKAFKNKANSKTTQYLTFSIIVIIHTLVLGKWKHWYGGWSFGYRMASDTIPFLTLLLVPFVKSGLFNKYKKAFAGLFTLSVLVQLFGIIFFDGIWHAAYDLGYNNTSWLWSLRNSEFIFNIRRVLVKLGLRDSPF